MADMSYLLQCNVHVLLQCNLLIVRVLLQCNVHNLHFLLQRNVHNLHFLLQCNVHNLHVLLQCNVHNADSLLSVLTRLTKTFTLWSVAWPQRCAYIPGWRMQMFFIRPRPLAHHFIVLFAGIQNHSQQKTKSGSGSEIFLILSNSSSNVLFSSSWIHV